MGDNSIMTAEYGTRTGTDAFGQVKIQDDGPLSSGQEFLGVAA